MILLDKKSRLPLPFLALLLTLVLMVKSINSKLIMITNVGLSTLQQVCTVIARITGVVNGNSTEDMPFLLLYLGNHVDHLESCEVADAFADDSLMPSLDGKFNFTIIQEPLNLKELRAVKVIYSGTYINNKLRRNSRRLRRRKSRRWQRNKKTRKM